MQGIRDPKWPKTNPWLRKPVYNNPLLHSVLFHPFIAKKSHQTLSSTVLLKPQIWWLRWLRKGGKTPGHLFRNLPGRSSSNFYARSAICFLKTAIARDANSRTLLFYACPLKVAKKASYFLHVTLESSYSRTFLFFFYYISHNRLKITKNMLKS